MSMLSPRSTGMSAQGTPFNEQRLVPACNCFCEATARPPGRHQHDVPPPVERFPSMPAPAVIATSRDLRLDLFRGLALWLIFLDHIPSNAVSWVTIRNYGFSDATEIFVFISGYTAAFVYGRAMQINGFIVAAARVLKRTWQI